MSEQLSSDQFQCARCQQIYKKAWTEEEAEQETQQYWGNLPQENFAVICDDCWQQVHPDTRPVEYQATFIQMACDEAGLHWLEVQEAIAKQIIEALCVSRSMLGELHDKQN